MQLMRVEDKGEFASGDCQRPGISIRQESQLRVYSALILFLSLVVEMAPAQSSSRDCGTSSVDGPIRVFSQIEAVRPAPQAPEKYPMGNDLVLRAAGSADIHLATTPVVIESATAVRPGTATITVSSTRQLCPGTADCGIFVDSDTPREEAIAPGNWHVDSSTQITAKFAMAHPAGFRIRQVGVVAFDTSRVVMVAMTAAVTV